MILGKEDGMPLALAVAELGALGDGSRTMLEPTNMLVALSDPVTFCDWTGEGFGVTTTGVDEITGVGVSVDSVEDTTVPNVNPLLEGGVDAGTSDAGTLEESADSVRVEVGETPVPTDPEGGKIPELVGLGVGVTPDGVGVAVPLTTGGVMPEAVSLRVSLGIGGRTLRVSDGVGTVPEGLGTPEEGTTPDGVATPEDGSTPEGVGTPEDGSTPEGVGRTLAEISERMLEKTLLTGGSGTGKDPVGVGSSESKLDTMLGTTDPGASGTAEDKRLDTSETSEEMSGGMTPVGVGVADGVIGAVGPALPDGRTPETTPETSDTREDRIDGRSSGPEGEATSEVGMAPDAPELSTGLAEGAPVPSAVVMPTTMPPEEDWTINGSLDGDSGLGVGDTMMLGKIPVDPMTGSRTDERTPSRGPCDGVGWITDEGTPAPVEPATIPVEPETMKGPWMDDTVSFGVSDGSGDGTTDELAGTTTGGMLPVGACGEEG